jgi:energy-coupling factor transport system substrate-specific component
MTGTHPPQLAGVRRGWRTVDIVVAAAIAVAFGVVFQAWNLLWNALNAAFVAFPPGQGFMYGMWLVPAVLGGLIIRKPGASIFCEFVAALVSVLVGAPWASVLLLYGLVQGAGAEIVFAAMRYRRFTLPISILAGALAAVGSAVLDIVLYFVAGAGSWFLVRALAATGVLAPFAAGREHARAV